MSLKYLTRREEKYDEWKGESSWQDTAILPLAVFLSLSLSLSLFALFLPSKAAEIADETGEDENGHCSSKPVWLLFEEEKSQ